MTDTTEQPAKAGTDDRTHWKGLSKGTVGLLGGVVIGVSTIAPAYTLSGSLGPTASAVGDHLPAILLVGFVPMLLVAIGYRQLNKAMPDSGTTFTWVSRAFGPWVGWMGSWCLLAATILVLSNLAGIAVDFFYLAISQISGQEWIAGLTRNVPVNIVTCLAFMAAAAWISYRGMEATKTFQYVLVSLQVVVLLWFSVAAFSQVASGAAFDGAAVSLEWFNPFGVDSFSAFAAGVSLSVFVYWGWDVVVTMNEESRGTTTTPGKAAIVTILVVVTLYTLVSVATLSFSGVSTGELGLGNPDIQGNVFAALAGPVMGPFAVLMSLAVLSSSASSLQSTMISPARTMLAMGHYGALPAKYARVSPVHHTPGYATVVAVVIASVFYAVMRVLSENVLWDTITTLGMMVCFYYGVTALACVWYFRREAASSPGSLVTKLVAPLLGGILLLVFFFQTAWDSMDPAYGSGSQIGGVGLVFVLGVAVFVLGAVAMVVQYLREPGFFRRRFATTEYSA
ncbi:MULTISPECIES: APC family permease [Nocardiopsis]|uniref:Amino acid transporter n=1 Tax=Nocardiopsis sinuspersici TaxID=501010 RepID=A0A1V3BZ84_9ACTN|nr:MULTISPECIES: APC family permease [Nocardiopsis]OOC53692.1 amino acid transporter [Nocardiopsis sinuspersici]